MIADLEEKQMVDFKQIRTNIIGNDLAYDFDYGKRDVVYADWTASGRLYKPIEEYITDELGPFVANTHTETTLTGTRMTKAYHQAQKIIKRHVNANEDDVIISAGFGMTAVINKLQRIMGLRVPELFCSHYSCKKIDKPLVIITHMEHHSNQTTWNECFCDVEIIARGDDGLPDLDHLAEILENNRERKLKIGSFSGCSNVTGIITPYGKMARIMHQYGGLCFVDFAASAPYVEIDMHPADELETLDAIFFSPHKFLGGPGSSGVMIFNKAIYKNKVPDHPGGGTVKWTNPWGEQEYFENIEVREDGGTPGFLQTIKAALAILLKEEMGVQNILKKEEILKDRLIERLRSRKAIQILEDQQMNRLAIISFYSLELHHNLIVKLLNDRFGIQTRGGCSCAGTYGHILMDVDRKMSQNITKLIHKGDLSSKPGWVRISLHPTMTLEEIDYIADSLFEVIDHYDEWEKDYEFQPHMAEFQLNKKRAESFNLESDYLKKKK